MICNTTWRPSAPPSRPPSPAPPSRRSARWRQTPISTPSRTTSSSRSPPRRTAPARCPSSAPSRRRQEAGKRRAEEASERRAATRSDPRPVIAAPADRAPWLPVVAVINSVLAKAGDVQRNANCDLSRISKQVLPNTHLLVGETAKDGLPPPEQWLLRSMTEMEVAEVIEKHIDYTFATRTASCITCISRCRSCST